MINRLALYLGLFIHFAFVGIPCHSFSASRFVDQLNKNVHPHNGAKSRLFHQHLNEISRSRPSSPTSSSSSSSSLRSQILDFVEPTTGVKVKLLGAMHYNPASIQLTTDTINALAAEDKLGSVIIESCDIRWNSTLENKFIQSALQSEMRAAHDLGLLYRRPVVLGDQRINITVAQLKNGAREAMTDLIQPWNGGWKRLFDSIQTAREEAVPFGSNFLGIGSFLDPKLLLAAPVILIKYPMSYFVKSPVATAVVLSVLVLLSGDEASANSLANEELGLPDMLVSLLVSALETVVFARIFLKELLAERNEVLAFNILEQCRNYQSKEERSPWIFFPAADEQSDKSTGAVYAPGSVTAKPEEGKVVVAVLGLAHCNGIKKILTENEKRFPLMS
mmetsp:Transcript_11139/g.22810  ORF Transcript_11139/g.22810 Transcript_11139/m.22810 type:complete len:391 (+) Transcript_11139:121-1293(+)